MNYLKIRFTDNSYYRPESWTWDFGDGTTYDGKRPYYHSFTHDGEYEVCLTVSNENSTNTYCESLSKGTISTDDLSNPVEVTIYPNPVDDFTTFQIHNYLPEKGYVELYDVTGKLVKKDRVYHGWNTFDLSSLSTGV